MEKVHSKLDLIYGTVQRMSCSTANPLLSHTLSAIQFWCPIASNYPNNKKGGVYVQSTESSSVSDGSSDSGTSSSDDMEASVKKQDKSAKKKKEHSIKKSSKQKIIRN